MVSTGHKKSENSARLTPLFLGSDHAGFDLKSFLKQVMTTEFLCDRYHLDDLGVHDTRSVDYPDIANMLSLRMRKDDAALGILICGTGIGISIAANRHHHIRAALCHSTTDARFSRQHNNANILVLGARTTGYEVAVDILRIFLQTPFEGGRHQRRIDKMLTTG